MTRPRYFVIFGAMRTGSNLLERTLDDYDGLVGLGELFNRSFIGKPGVSEAYGFSLAERNLNPVKFLEKVIAAHDGEIPGFRVFNGHDARIIDHAARDPACAKLVLNRDRVDSFVSLQIAERTGQWMLRKDENRRTAKIHFDAEAFEAYRTRVDAHYEKVRDASRDAGQALFEISYDELGRLELLNGAACFAGSSEVKDKAAPKIRRQNPAGLDEKVENADDARAAQDARAAPAEEERGPHLHPLRRLIVSRGIELIYAPVPGAADREILALIRAAETRLGKDDKDIVTGLKGGQVERRRRRGAFVFSFARHPVNRLREAYERVLEAPGQYFAATEALVSDYGSPALAALLEDRNLKERGFEAFIRFTGDSVGGRAAAAPEPLWALQSTLLAEYARETPIDFVGRVENFTDDARFAMTRLGLAEHLDLVGVAPDQKGEWLTSAVEDAIYEVYSRDYLRLGYQRIT